MILKSILSIFIAYAFGYLLVSRSWPKSRTVLLPHILALPAGFALTSASYFLWLSLTKGENHWYPLAEGTLLVAVMAAAWRPSRKRMIATPDLSLPRRFQVRPNVALLSLALLVAAALCFTISVKLAGVNPWGYWDAWARINLKARFLYAGGEHWTWIFEGTRIAHHDYPLLLQCAIARLWLWNGEITLTVPQVLSVTWGVWSFALLYGMVAWLRSPVTAAITSLLYLTYTPLLFWSAMQYTDIPLACYMILACTMMVAAGRCRDDFRNFSFLAGFFAGSAAWCKNEGILFAAVVALWWFALAAGRRLSGFKRAAMSMFGGLAIIGSATIYLKLGYALRNDLIDGDFSHFGLIVDSSRHQMILDHFWSLVQTQWNGWPLLILTCAFVLSQWRHRRLAHAGPLLCTVTMAAFYYLAFATTPHDLSWHLGTTMDRLLLHLWPLLLLGLAMLFEEQSNIHSHANITQLTQP